MSTQELSDQFDVLFNNITSNQAPGLNEYEKSVFLTKAQEEIIKNYFNPKANPKQDGFDDTPKRQADFATLIMSTTPREASGAAFDVRTGIRSYVLPDDIFLCLNEQFTDGKIPLTVVPISYTDYDRLMSKPYKYPPKYQVWRLITKNTVSGETVITKIAGEGSLYIPYQQPPYVFHMTTSINCLKEVTITMDFSTMRRPESPVTIDEGDTSVSIAFHLYADDTLPEFSIDTVRTDISSYVSNITWPEEDPDNAIRAHMMTMAGSGSSLAISAQTTVEEHTEDTTTTTAEFIGRFYSPNPTYRIRYVKRPNPIILADFGTAENDLSIQGKSDVQPLNLPDELYEEILQRAVELAKVAWTSTGQENVNLVLQAGQRSE